ncbi:TadE/TadG family type IV pilus assembly protein [Hyphomonas sp.]|uniref:vWA domain-containing protein n=1 Tax=Hyphomonas sp. TaxID=87 RepID=UPI0032424328
MLKKLTSWKENRDGNVAIILAIAIVPILVLVGIAIDLQNTNTSRQFIQYTMDNAVIAGSREMQAGKSKAEINAYINKFVDGVVKAKNYAISCKPVEVAYSEDSQDINATIKCQQETTLTELIGYHYLDFTVTSGSTYGIGKVDVSFVFDISGSMGWDGKMDALKDAAEDAVDVLLPTGATADMGDVRISMVSYSDYLDAGDYFQKVTNKSPTRTYSDTYTTTERVCVEWRRNGRCRRYEYQYVEHTTTKKITNTCVKERLGSEAYTDEDPGPFAWIEAVDAEYDAYRDRWNVDSCNPIGPLPLTDNRSKLKTYINGLNANGGTAGHIGIAWGWYAISPKWHSVWPSGSDPLDYDEPDSAKAMIIMTDGDFLNWHNNGEGSSFDQAKKLCDSIKEEGVRVYTVAFQAPNQGKEILEYCASGTEFAFKAESADELTDAYTKIAQSISDLRITY